jgi:hypothetical protein
MTSFTISIEPSRSPGKVTAMSSDGHSFTTTMPLLDGARYCQQLGALCALLNSRVFLSTSR